MSSSSAPTIRSSEIKQLTLHRGLPSLLHIYVLPFLAAYPYAIHIYTNRYDQVLGDQANTFLLCLVLFGSHALSFLSTRWSTGIRARTTAYPASSVQSAEIVRVIPHLHRGPGELCKLLRSRRPDGSQQIYFVYQRDKFTYDPQSHCFVPLEYPCDVDKELSGFQSSHGIDAQDKLDAAQADYGKNIFDIPVPTFRELFAEHAVAPFFVFQLFCVGLWCLDEYWYYSIFTLFMLVVFECTTVFQRQKTLGEFRTMSIKPYNVYVRRLTRWVEIASDELLPGDLVSIVRSKADSGSPADLLLLAGSCIVNEAMLSGESTPLLKESIELRPGSDVLDIQGADRNSVLFGGTKILQATSPDERQDLKAPDGGCLALVLRTGFGTSQGQLIRTMVFSTETVSANNFESFMFIAFLLVFAIAASAYVWIKGVEMQRPRMKLLLDCVIIITSVVPPELPMELSLAVNASLVALSKYAIFCTEPFRIPFAGRVDVCCFDKTGTITGENLVVEGVAGTVADNSRSLVAVGETSYETTLTLASAHALVLLDDGIVGDPMEKTTLDALRWKVSKGDQISPQEKDARHRAVLNVKRRYQFSSALKRMSTVSTLDVKGSRKTFVAVKGAPETLRTMYSSVPADYEATYKWFAQRGSRVLALGYKWIDGVSESQVRTLDRERVESSLIFAGFLVFHCPLKADAVSTLKALNDSSHRCIMITGDNPLTAVHVARDVEIVDRDVLILDLKEGAAGQDDFVWRMPDESKIIPVDIEAPIEQDVLDNYDLCMTGTALKAFAERPAWQQLVQHVWVYARVSPAQKEFILTSLKNLGFVTLMAGDGTNDVGALKQANIGVALLDGSPEDLQKIAEHQRTERLRKVYETQLNLSMRWGQPPPPVPAVVAAAFPDLVNAQKEQRAKYDAERTRNPGKRPAFDLSALTGKMADIDDEEGPPQIKLGDASVAAPFTSKLSNVVAVANIIRQGRCTLVATVQMYKILALNCLISAYALSVQYLDGIKAGDYQVTVQGILMSICFMCISRAKPVDGLSKKRPLGNIFNFYVAMTVLLQFAVHIAALVYITSVCKGIEPHYQKVDLEAKFEPNLLNSAIYLLSLSQQISTFVFNFEGRPFREDISENSALYYGLLGVAAVAVNGATNFQEDVNKWLQLTDMTLEFRLKLILTMALDFGIAYLMEVLARYLFVSNAPKDLITRGTERREARRVEEKRLLAIELARIDSEQLLIEKKEL
ncbi:hypothetical protein E5Q_00895 [Mixia osmundae IAM 14324]|uniref:Cation-transporting ATPase n=1 Tax=Mixia osmundae (strain CBS 9802 / IAM 14324 / JCM 22182 / KY 12970) TaxID=764103 RepID=G7DUI6_MIXOS|nr:hypothetical protein E5Q_00895 [Mixia osmundae IAM 14324]